MLLIVTIVSGFELQQKLPLILWTCISASGGFAVVDAIRRMDLWLRKRQWRPGKRWPGSPVLTWVWLAAGFTAAGFLTGGLREMQAPAVSPFPLNSAILLQTTVTQVQAVNGGTKVILSVHHMENESNQVSQRVAFPVEWLIWDTPTTLQAGENAQVEGVLQEPPVQTSSGVAVRQALAGQGIHYEFQGHLLSSQSTPGGGLTGWFYGWEDPFLKRINDGLLAMSVPPEDASLLEGIVFGNQASAPSGSQHQDFLRSGLLHILAASGANVFLMEQFFHVLLWPLRWLRPLLHYPQFVIHGMSIVLTWGFCALCGYQPSIVRATVMSNYRALGLITSRRASSWNGLLMAAIVMSIVLPGILLNTSSLLNFVATAAVQRAMSQSVPFRRKETKPGLSGRLILILKPVAKRLVSTIQITFTVELYLTPLLIFLFQQLTPLAMVANVLAEPLLFLLLPVTATVVAAILLKGVVSWLVPAILCKGLVAANLTLLHWLLDISQLIAHSPVALYQTQTISLTDVCSYYVFILGLSYLVKWVISTE